MPIMWFFIRLVVKLILVAENKEMSVVKQQVIIGFALSCLVGFSFMLSWVTTSMMR